MKMMGKISIHLLEMVTARMSQIMLIAALTEEIVVDHVSLPVIAKIVPALGISLAMEFLVMDLEMDSVMMKPTMLPVNLTKETVV